MNKKGTNILFLLFTAVSVKHTPKSVCEQPVSLTGLVAEDPY